MASRSKSNAPFVIILFLALGLTASLIWGARWIGQERANALPAASQTIESAELTSTRLTRIQMVIGERGVLTYGISRFKLRAGHYPAALSELMHRPDDLKASDTWHGPYVSTEGFLFDPWENAYAYRVPGLHNTESYDLWSLGPDGEDNTGDEIGNWNLPEDAPAAAEQDPQVSSAAADWERNPS